MDKILSLLRLDSLKGSRTQITILLWGAINFLASAGFIKLTAEDLNQINQFLTWAGAYFFAAKVSK